ncbi:hypothetical protein B0G84_5756 [Paraburkholderia sp. BL8N3]|nr:hypothetical protein B0G84_5756 [Paraburkholderia sp. BL8N3]
MESYPDWATYQTYALAALSESDRTVIRCYENGIAVPAEWTQYRRALRAIVRAPTGEANKPLPIKPPYPSET